jgi:hypothetical protein
VACETGNATIFDWVLKASLDEHVAPGNVVTDQAATLLAAKLKTPLRIGQHLARAFEAAFEIGAKPIDASVVEAVLSRQMNNLEPQRLRRQQPGRAVRCEAIGDPSDPSWRSRPGTITGTHGRNARRRPAHVSVSMIVRRTARSRVRLNHRVLSLR